MGFGQSLSGLSAASQNLDVIGNNIANSSTVGFKSSTISFADVYAASSSVGLGVQVASVNQRFTTGNISVSGNQFDMAIDGNKGLFRLVDNTGAVFYSRNGQFIANKDFDIVNAQGLKLTGFNALEDGTITNEIVPIKVPIGNIAPQPTNEITLKANFDSRSPVIPATTPPATLEDVRKPENHTHSLPITVYDSLGNSHQLTQYFVKRDAVGTGADAESVWDVYYDAGNDANDTSIVVTPLKNTLNFDGAGRLATGSTTAFTVGWPVGGSSPAANMNVNVNYAGSTQFGGEFSPSFTQNGYTTGEYSSMAIADDGSIIASYTNGESKIMGALVLADFNNLNGLKSVGGGAWVETGESGQAVLGQPGNNGFANVKGQAVEESNVDLSQELVNMIIAQRTYQANAQTIKTQDQILQTLITLR